MTYADPQGLFFFCAASRLEGGHGARLPGLFVVALVFISTSSLPFERGEGLAPFT
jgi:hypothetical protein